MQNDTNRDRVCVSCFKPFQCNGYWVSLNCPVCLQHRDGDVKSIYRLTAEVKRLREALAQYALLSNWCDRNDDYTCDEGVVWVGPGEYGCSLAQAALSPERKEESDGK